MKKSILKLEGLQLLNSSKQKAINGGGNACWLQACGITKEYCVNELLGVYNKNTGCCGYVPYYC